MIDVENIDVWGFDHAIRGMRNPMNSWDRSDSTDVIRFVMGENDLDLMQRLCKAGQPHRKYLRQIMVSMDITAPLYWWKEFDTYKVGTTSNSCSTMHKIHAKRFEPADFSIEHIYGTEIFGVMDTVIAGLNGAREQYLKTNDKKYWWYMIQLLPTSYNQKRTITMNYENVLNMLEYRQGHKLDEWNIFCEILKELPYIKEIINEQ